jgi:hypothetical protein
MGCKCSKDEEQGDLEVSEYEENYNEDDQNNEVINTNNENMNNQEIDYNNYNEELQNENENEKEFELNKNSQKTGFFKVNNNMNSTSNTGNNYVSNEEDENVFSKTQVNQGSGLGKPKQLKQLKQPVNNDVNTLESNDFTNNNFPSMSNYDQSFANKKKKKPKIHINAEYNKEVLRLFSLARNKPLSYCKHIDYCIGLITTNAEGQLVIGTEKTNKIGLKEGISKFNECKRFLLQIESCSELIYDKELEIEISDDPEIWLNNEYIKNKIIEKQLELSNNSSNNTDNTDMNNQDKETLSKTMSSNKKSKKSSEYSIFGFHFDFGMHDPVISSVLQLVDDNNCENRRRYNIMNSEYKAVGITNKVQGKKFVSYFFFAG